MTKKTQTTKISSLDKLNAFFEARKSYILWMSLALTAVFGLLLFEPKVSIGGDDSMYINRAYNFIYKGSFPTFQGPLYPIFLGLIIYLLGTKLLLFKIISLACYMGHQWFTFKTFKNHLAPISLFVFLLLLSTSAAILFYASSTYNEVFYLFVQSIFIYHFTKSYVEKDRALNLRKDYKSILLSGFLLLLVAVTKNVGLVAALAAIAYFLFVKNWKMSISMAICFILFMGIFSFAKSTFWEVKEMQISNQLDALISKVPYRQDSEKEDAYGFLMRLVDNSKAYLGYHFRNIFGLASPKKIEPNTVFTLLIYALFTTGFFIALRKSKFWLFIGIFTFTALGVTFLILQTFWLQERLIIAFTPVVLAFLFYVLFYLFTNGLKKYSMVLVVIFGIAIFANLYRSATRIPEQIKIVSKYLSGDKYYGFPDDWIYYLKMTAWVSEHLPEEAYVACRKPGMAFVYSGGKDFYGIWKVPSNDPEVLYNKLKDAGVTHIIMASLRTNSDDPNARIINTVRRYLSAINKAYPGRLKMVHQIGERWPAYLYELH
ncbi:MAG: hypothetical protein MI975_16405 [Cytophagales bacterium]|nr:hypothetical protein [Cytophagales bacterium]